MTDQNQLLRKWRIDYDNDTGNNDGGFWEWWTLTDGVRSFKCDSEADAQWLHAALSHPAQPAPAQPRGAGEAVAYRETLTGRLCEPDDTHRRKFPMCYRPLTYADTSPPATQQDLQSINTLEQERQKSWVLGYNAGQKASQQAAQAVTKFQHWSEAHADDLIASGDVPTTTPTGAKQ